MPRAHRSSRGPQGRAGAGVHRVHGVPHGVDDAVDNGSPEGVSDRELPRRRTGRRELVAIDRQVRRDPVRAAAVLRERGPSSSSGWAFRRRSMGARPPRLAEVNVSGADGSRRNSPGWSSRTTVRPCTSCRPRRSWCDPTGAPRPSPSSTGTPGPPKSLPRSDVSFDTHTSFGGSSTGGPGQHRRWLQLLGQLPRCRRCCPERQVRPRPSSGAGA